LERTATPSPPRLRASSEERFPTHSLRPSLSARRRPLSSSCRR
jgi:hypothetical protein